MAGNHLVKITNKTTDISNFGTIKATIACGVGSQPVVNAEGTTSGKSLKSPLVIFHPWAPDRTSRPAITVDTWNTP